MTDATQDVTDASAVSTSESGTATSDTGGSEGTTSGTTTGVEATPELCATATSEEECHGLSTYCTWQPVYEVLDIETCELSEVEYSCWARSEPPWMAGCFGLYPQVCYEMDIRPLYREVDGVLFLIDLQAACHYKPLVAEGEPEWQFCETDKFEPQPPVCYCLCGEA